MYVSIYILYILCKYIYMHSYIHIHTDTDIHISNIFDFKIAFEILRLRFHWLWTCSDFNPDVRKR